MKQIHDKFFIVAIHKTNDQKSNKAIICEIFYIQILPRKI